MVLSLGGQVEERSNMKREECRRFELCEAPLCPLEPCGIWYADEQICTARQFQTKKWVQKQKKIAKVATADNGFFSIPMLECVGRVTKQITGGNPDVWESEEKWLKKMGHTPAKTVDKKVTKAKNSNNTRRGRGVMFKNRGKK